MRKKSGLWIGLLAATGYALYRLRRQILRKLMGLPPVRFRVRLQKDLAVKTGDGVSLATDVYSPQGRGLFPSILIRTPYGRRGWLNPSGFFTSFAAQRFAERGFHVIVQDVRGRFDSQGEFEPFCHEAEDGMATLRWLEGQPWFNRQLGMWGPSYLGYVQWAVAQQAPPYLRAIMPMISGSQLPRLGFRDRAFSLDTLMRWILELDAMDHLRDVLGIFYIGRMSQRRQEKILQRVSMHLPLGDADIQLVGREIPFYREWISHAQIDDPFWWENFPEIDVRETIAATHFISGWFDILLQETLEDYSQLCAANQRPYLTIGPWGHISPELIWESLRQGLAWFEAYLKGDRHLLRRKPVRIYVIGANEWRDMDAWPPPGKETRLYLHNPEHGNPARRGRLSSLPSENTAEPLTYVYDPARPTPAVGGALMSFHAGQVDNRDLEAREDVLVYSSQPLENPVEILGPVQLRLFVRSSCEHTDFYARLCDVSPDGRSLNVCDGLLRLYPQDTERQENEACEILIGMSATAYQFQKGHRLRLVIASGAHPRWNRNLGTGEPIATAVNTKTARQRVYGDKLRPSALLVSLTSGELP